jgi:hypothetical protein
MDLINNPESVHIQNRALTKVKNGENHRNRVKPNNFGKIDWLDI